MFFLSVGGRCHKRSARQGKYTVVFLPAGTNVVSLAVLKPDKIMNEILKSPELLPLLSLFEKKKKKKKKQNNETLWPVALAAAVSPFSHLFFPPSQSCFPSSYFLLCFSTLFI